jgi:multidrug efflux pump subunit AcrB
VRVDLDPDKLASYKLSPVAIAWPIPASTNVFYSFY